MSENNNKQKRKRVCPHCGRKLWMREFYPLKNGGRSSWCHECVLEYKRERYRKTRKVPDGTFMHRTQGRIVEHNGYSTRIFWNGNMLSIMRRHYHNTLNRELANARSKELGYPGGFTKGMKFRGNQYTGRIRVE